MSLTSYRAAPSRAKFVSPSGKQERAQGQSTAKLRLRRFYPFCEGAMVDLSRFSAPPSACLIQLSFRKRQVPSGRVPSARGADCQSRLCFRRLPCQLTGLSPKFDAKSVQPCLAPQVNIHISLSGVVLKNISTAALS